MALVTVNRRSMATAAAATAVLLATTALVACPRDARAQTPAIAGQVDTAAWPVSHSPEAMTDARTALVDMAFFYAILLVGFAYVWYRGDLDWVRAVSAERAASPASRAA